MNQTKPDFGLGDWGSYLVRNWGSYLVRNLIHPFTIFATTAFILILIVYFIFNAFRISVYAGVQSLAGALLPLIIANFILIFNRDLITYFAKINNLIGFSSAMIWGFIVMVVIRFFGSMNVTPIPISELILSGSFSILVFSHAEGAQSKIFLCYYGMICGFLLYIIVFGFPPNVLRVG